MKKVSVIIPVYNEAKEITACLESLSNQSYQNIEVIVVDDGSTDETLEVLSTINYPASPSPRLRRVGAGAKRGEQLSTLKLLRQQHKGPGMARNLGAAKASGDILVFVDADMTFDKNFIEKLVSPIVKGKTVGTFSKDEFVSNKDSVWSACWNINRNLPKDRMLPKNYPNTAPVFRAILKKEFDRVGGFETTGQYIDDWSLSQKLGTKSQVAPDAIYYHANPSTLKEVWRQARWIGKNNFISGNFLRILKSLLIYNPAASIIVGITKSVIYQNINFLIFKLTYDFAILTSVIKSFAGEAKSK